MDTGDGSKVVEVENKVETQGAQSGMHPGDATSMFINRFQWVIKTKINQDQVNSRFGSNHVEVINSRTVKAEANSITSSVHFEFKTAEFLESP